MERGSAKHSARADDELAKELDARLHRGGAQPEPWKEPEPIDAADLADPGEDSEDAVPAPEDLGDDAGPSRVREHPDLGPQDTMREI